MPAPASEPPTAVEIRALRPGDGAAVLEAFNRVFAAVDPGFAPRDRATWDWLYRDAPHGARSMLAVASGGRVLAQYAALCQRVRLADGEVRFSQSIDSLADRERSAGLKAPGVFVRTGWAFAEAYGGASPERDAVMWGLPVRPAWRIGARHLGYELLRPQLALRADPTRVAAGPALEVDEPERIPPACGGELFERFAAGRGAVGVRDADWLAWRFDRRPDATYARAVVPGAGGAAPRGLAVYRAGRFEGERAGLVAEWLVPPDDDEAAAVLLAWLARRARADGVELVALFPETSPELAAFQRAGFRVRRTGYLVAARAYTRHPDVEWLREHWHYGLGDTDLA